MKKTSTVASESNKSLAGKLTIGLDLGDRWSWYRVLDESGEVIGEQKVGTTQKAMREAFQRCRAAGWRWRRGCTHRG